MKNIVLIGFMGCGKSTFGKKISKKLNYQFVDTDKWIEKQQGQTISSIFATQGEAAFRQMETEAAQTLSKEEGLVLSTGGGMVKTPKTMEALCQNAIVVYLKATPEHIFQNIGHDTTRPLLQTDDKLEAIRRLMEEREDLYQRYATVTVTVSGHSITGTTNAILHQLEGLL